ncbi:hypothetical protein RclHR1_13440005 [Rhizophagus clarus]|uniref:RRM domain-containing protein n=1 Tax=Rhizophagus clarus TaxID=94130 RepID=A0A2Z6Q9Z5_9GLOM|nr:hypothetical protein RclHR1_13440005 [Rhizophagus clarus]
MPKFSKPELFTTLHNQSLSLIPMGGILFLDLPKSHPVSLYGGPKIFSSCICRHAHPTAPNIKDIDLAFLIRELGAKAVNVPLSLNSYKPKRWAYITFPSQKLMDAAMKQLIGYQGHTLQWNLPDDTNKLCHRCGNLICAHALARALSFSFVLRTPPSSSARTPTPSLSPQDASEILSLLKALQQDMANVRDRITALELNDQRMARIERHIGLQPLSSVSPNTTQTSDMNIDQPGVSNPSLTQNSLRAKPSSRPLNPLLPDFVPLTSPVIPAHTSSSAVIASA